MAATATETQYQPQSAPPITVLTRMASIPMIQSSLESINGVLSTNAYTRAPYCTAKDISMTAYRYTEPIQIRLAPMLVRADGFANMAVDAVESRYPYPFKAKPEELADMVRERRKDASSYVDKVTSPAYQVAQDIDQRFAPIVDYIEVAVSRLNSSETGPSSPGSDSKFQYQRALALSRTLKDNLYEYSNEQMKQIHAHSVLVQKATETAHSITTLATSSMTNAQTRIHSLSDTMLQELQRLQASTSSLSASFQNSAATTLHNSSAQIQSQILPQVQQTYSELSTALSSAISNLAHIITTKDLSLQDKVTHVGHEVQERVSPLLDSLKKTISELVVRGKSEASDKAAKVKEGNGADGTNGRVIGSK